MQRTRITYVKNIVTPCLLFSAVTGVLTGGWIFAFRKAAGWVSLLSETAFEFVRANPLWLGSLFCGAVILGLLSWALLRWLPECRGGGIPTSIGQLRGILPLRWFSGLLAVFGSSMVTYLGGIPLGTEGPSVQMGTAIGRGAVRILGRKNPAWNRYVMTGGACAGFAAATGAPLTGILFAFEEAHRRFSPMLFMVSSMTVTFASVTTRILYHLNGEEWDMFAFAEDAVLPLRALWIPALIGLLCGITAALFTRLYGLLNRFLNQTLGRIPFFVKVLSVFLLVAVAGFFVPSSLGSGHGLIEDLLSGGGLWEALILLLILRMALLLLANNVGITGGLFVPSLAFGAILGALCGKALIFANLLPEEYYAITVIVGMSSFLGASSRIPLTAIAFSLEALSGSGNMIPVVLGVGISYLVIEVFGIPSFSDAVLERKVHAFRSGKTSETRETEVTVRPGSFVIGKEIRDILWPPSLVVLSVDRNPAAARGGGALSEGDVLHLHYQTCDPVETEREIEALVGRQ